ncbi:hypothetical protein KFE98_10490 [bacterium SCSIO 12741]|nr:hypothetical protein KFE98_10490 [bacterium SCSIO 12741]
MKNHFNWALEDTMSHTSLLFDWEPEMRPGEYSFQLLNPGPKEIQVESQGWLSAKGKASLKYARFRSAIIDIATIMIYPTASPEQLPVFASEWVCVMNNLHVIVMDVSYLTDNRAVADLVHLRQSWAPQFPEQKSYPEWFSEIASPQSVFSKATLEAMDEVRAMYNDFLTYTTNQIYTPNYPLAHSGIDHDLVREYKSHHATHSPARSIVKDENREWLELFLKDYHFGIHDVTV